MNLKTQIIESAKHLKRATKQHSPEILLGLGIVGVVGGTVLACKATTKLDRILDEADDRKQNVDKVLSDPKKYISEDAVYTEEDAENDKRIIKVQTVGSIVKAYAPAVLLEFGGLACICASFGILKKREAAVAGMLAATERAYAAYRKRVADKYGEEEEQNIFYDIQETTVIDVDENNNTTETKVKTPNNLTDKYTFIFDAAHFKTFKEDARENGYFLLGVQDAFNSLLRDGRAATSKKGRGYVYLDEVLEQLGYIWDDKDSKEAWTHLAGFVYDQNDPSCDNCVDFGLGSPVNEAFNNGDEPVAILNFNCCGNVWQRWADGADCK